AYAEHGKAANASAARYFILSSFVRRELPPESLIWTIFPREYMPDRHPSLDGRLARHCWDEREAIPPARPDDARAVGIRGGDRSNLCRRHRTREAQPVRSGSEQDRDGAWHGTSRIAQGC